MFPINRIDGFYLDASEPPPRQSVADRLLCGAYGVKVELLKFTDDDGTSEVSCSIELRSEISGHPDDVLAALLEQFRNGGGEAVSQ